MKFGSPSLTGHLSPHQNLSFPVEFSANSRRICRYAKRPCNPFGICRYKTQDLKSSSFCRYEKKGGYIHPLPETSETTSVPHQIICAKRLLLLREVRVCLHFQDLQRVPPGVAGQEQHPLVRIHGSNCRYRVVVDVVPQIFLGRLNEIFGLGAALEELLHSVRPRHGRLGWVDRFRSRCLVRAVLQHGNQFVVFSCCRRTSFGRQRCLHHAIGDAAEDKALGKRDMVCALRHGPAVRRRLEVPLCFRKSLRSIQERLLRTFQLCDPLLSFRLGQRLRRRRCHHEHSYGQYDAFYHRGYPLQANTQVWANCIALFHADVGYVFCERIFLVLAKSPICLEMVIVQKCVERVVHVPRVGILQIGYAHEIELNRFCYRIVTSRHRRLIPGHAVVRQFQLVAIQVVKRDHLHRLPVFFHAEFFQQRRAAGGQFQAQRRLLHVRRLRLPIAHQRLHLLERFRPISSRRRGTCSHRTHRQNQHRHRQFVYHRLSPSSHLKYKIYGSTPNYCVASFDSVFRPNLCVANPTIRPITIPGSMMSQKSAIPACSTTSKLNSAAMTTPTNSPHGIDRTFVANRPINAPAMSPFSIENVITLVITGARDGSKKPLKPSAKPSPPPTINPSTGFVTLILHSLDKNLLCVRVRLHYAEKIAFGIFAVRKISHSRNRRLRHDQFSAGLRHRGQGSVNGINSKRVRRGLHIAALHDAAVDSRRFLIARLHQPILHRPGPLFDLPAEHFLVERNRAVGIVHRNFKMNDSGHDTSPFSVLDLLRKSFLELRLFWLDCGAVFLRRKSHDQTHQAAGNNDFLVVVFSRDGIRHRRNRQRQQGPDKQSKQNSQRHRFHLTREKSDQHATDESFERRSQNNRHHFRAHFRRQPGRCSIQRAQYCPQQQSQQDFIHCKFLHSIEVVPRSRRIFSCSKGLYNGKANFFRSSGEKSRGPGTASLSRLLSTRWRSGGVCKIGPPFPERFLNRPKRATHLDTGTDPRQAPERFHSAHPDVPRSLLRRSLAKGAEAFRPCLPASSWRRISTVRPEKKHRFARRPFPFRPVLVPATCIPVFPLPFRGPLQQWTVCLRCPDFPFWKMQEQFRLPRLVLARFLRDPNPSPELRRRSRP